MKLLSKFRNEIIITIFLSVLYFVLRLIFLDRLPIFTDEAIYLRWAQIALQDSSWRFISLTDGKQPMFVWFAIVFLKFVQDPLIAGRLVSVFSGFFTLIGLWFLTYELFKNKRIAFFSSILYIFYPFAQVLDRMALYDSMVGTFFVWALYFSILLARKVKLDIAYTLGFIIGAGVLTKTSNFFSIYLLPFTLILFNFKEKLIFSRLIKWIIFSLFATAIAFGLYNILRLSPLFAMITAKNAIFVYPLSEWLTHPFTFFVGNLHGLLSWLLQYLTPSYTILIILSVALIKKFPREKMLLIIYFLVPIVALALFGRVIFPRFIFFMSLMLLPLAAFGLDYLISFIEGKFNIAKRSSLKNYYVLIITLFFVFYPAVVSLQLVVDPINAKIADADNSQYVNSWAAGWGVKESVTFFQNQAKNQKIFIATEGTFGLLPASMELYLVSNKNITIKGYWPIDIFPNELIEQANKMPTFIIYYQKDHIVLASNLPLKLLFQVKQGSNDSYYRVYQVFSK